MTKISLPSLELTILIVNFPSTNLKIALEIPQIENLKKHLMTKNTPYLMTTKEVNKYASTSKM